ncbi:hypothetical protein Pan216_57590 [Planctomycetes bacterium Pan216]|uniref:Glycosyltransferase RgtA/B/C/D-like domain-containing protein n=1 Tax=Kolteria novifilia TaxID=2527975 RepID=A0A518BD07_9BACT|nr:hypothetical protein Pan216_57590 [Planctomycetes bacterium Pan216]
MSGPSPIWLKLPTARPYRSLVLLIAATLPAFYTWSYGSLTEAQAVWGLLGLDVLDGTWQVPEVPTSSVPPFFTWMCALVLSVPFGDPFLTLPTPSYLFGLLSICTLYWIVLEISNEATALLSCFLLTLNRFFLEQVQSGEPTTAVLFWSLLSFVFYLKHLAVDGELWSRWTFAGAFSFAGLLLSSGLFALWLPALGLLEFVCRQIREGDNMSEALTETRKAPTVWGGVAVVVGGFALAAPFLMGAGWHLSSYSPWPAPPTLDHLGSLPIELAMTMPATIVLSCVGLFLALRETLKRHARDGNAIPLLWVLLASLAFSTTAPTPATLLFTIAPLLILAVNTLGQIMTRQIRDYYVQLIFMLVAVVFIVAQNAALRSLPSWISAGPLNAGQKWHVHLGVDLLVLAAALLIWLYRLTSRSDRDRRWLFGSYVVGTVLLACLPTLSELNSARRSDDPWYQLSQRLHSYPNVDLLLFVGEPPSSQLLLTVRSLYPEAQRSQAPDRTQAESILKVTGDRPLVLMTDPLRAFQSPLPISKGGKTVTLTEIFGNDVVVAYAPLGAVETKPDGLSLSTK